MLSSFCLFWLEIIYSLSIRNVSPKYEIWLRFYINYRQNMTNWLKFFLAFYILVGQPALLGWMMENTSLYELAGLNGLVFIISWIISAMSKSSEKEDKSEKKEENKVKLIEKSEQKVSRIENDNWVAIVEVEKKEERVVETNNNEDQNENGESLVENTEQKLEEKVEEKIPERSMKETVTIPKIVQPLSWHATPNKKRKKEVKWWQRLVLLFTLGVAALITWTLWEFLGNWGIGISLFLWRILYLVIGKLFDVNGFYNAKKLFTNWLYVFLILAWIGYGVYAMQTEGKSILPSDFSEKVSSYFKSRFETDEEESQVDTWDVIYVFEWTGEVIADTWVDLVDLSDDTWSVEDEIWNLELDTEVSAWTTELALENVQVENEVQPQSEVAQPEVKVETTSSTDSPNREVTRWEAIKHLLQWYKLSTKTDKSFTYVAKSNELYPYFKTAQEKAMIWTDVNPNKRISCETYMSLKWILEWWSVNIYDRSQTRVIYWNKANELGKTNGCARWGFVKVKNL